MLKLALIFGGRSAEHDISLASARFIADMLDPAAYEVIPIGITRSGVWVCPHDLDAALRDGLETVKTDDVSLVVDPSRPGVRIGGRRFRPLDFAFPMMHGTFAEDGTIQGLLELAGLPYAGAGVAASSVGMDKELMKAVFAGVGLPQAEYVVLRDTALAAPQAIAELEEKLCYPMFVKPANLGSSVGMTKVHDRSELPPALALAASYDRKVIVEQGIEGRELECSVLGNDRPLASLAGEVIPVNEYYDYESKYTDGMMEFVIPADIGAAKQAEAASLAIAAFSALDCCGYARCDFFLEHGSGHLLVNEINTIPGMTPTSGFPRLWAASGIGNRDLVERIIRLGLDRHQSRGRLRTDR